ncbi:hypothetical protein [Methanoculleus sp.]|uniref:hypothetical protein n=1 Tax=Methanoculleus sp. TaxID=90427 RepID=UPI00263840D9|nr:hypothetical protein [Methanoculleus sp.]MDD2253738.1 hypothetical protein [Methanoculleus sp.]MDD2788261.1 hypothetical protein [Methanoculleus sp.]MDD3217107.1 hypothetical protein [Methanoculleus sp.]MDD4314602.1 hypothetical protein [Methanoculleus sp.]MDD4472083.1 hypothetical protein [Methanoculleus sp.]
MANLTPALFLPPAPGWYRFLSSLAAPLFIGLAGMMVALSRTGKGRSLVHIATRGGLVILVGTFLHLLVFDCVPFLDMDVLYLIGLSLPSPTSLPRPPGAETLGRHRRYPLHNTSPPPRVRLS